MGIDGKTSEKKMKNVICVKACFPHDLYAISTYNHSEIELPKRMNGENEAIL